MGMGIDSITPQSLELAERLVEKNGRAREGEWIPLNVSKCQPRKTEDAGVHRKTTTKGAYQS